MQLRRYGPTFEEMYQQMEARQRERQNQLREQAAQGSVLDKVKQVRLLHPPFKRAAERFIVFWRGILM